MGIQRWTISLGRSGSLKLLRRCELRLEVKIRVFKSRREGKNAETNQQKSMMSFIIQNYTWKCIFYFRKY